ncbi:MAG: efflux RND transporter periplasmic adaptor subunit [Roseburia sp.]|nr:efflux RND transporter periplasmic adaptor subunit [Roseburia sp.]MCM1277772.1 efflux RND transporter periplasmic adaptor subunit [Robinsoniella sp.]
MENQVNTNPVTEQRPKKTKKKGKKKWFIIGGIVVIVIGYVAFANLGAKNIILPVNVTQALTGDITQTVESSGAVATEEEKVYFAQVNGKVSSLKVTPGANVKAGDNVVSYDLEDLESELKKVELEAKANSYGIDATVAGLNESQRKSSEAAANYEEATKYVAHYNECVGQINEQLAKANELSGQEASLKVEISELEAKLVEKPNSEKIESKLSEKKKELKRVTKELGKYNIAELQSALEVCSGDLAEYKAQKAQYEAAKEADPTIGSQKAQQSALKEVSKLTTETAQQNFRKAQDGVVIDFNGIISQVDVAEGQIVTEGTPLFTLESLENVKATMSVSKYDLEKIAIGQKAKVTINGKEYDGTLSAINKIAQANQSGTPMVNVDIHIENPDDNIFLGIEAKVSLETATKEKALLIPVECVNSDMDGDFCWAVENGIVTRKNIETGISTDTYIEILSGLKEGEQIVTDMTANLEEGMEVMPVEAEAGENGEEADNAQASE